MPTVHQTRIKIERFSSNCEVVRLRVLEGSVVKVMCDVEEEDGKRKTLSLA